MADPPGAGAVERPSPRLSIYEAEAKKRKADGQKSGGRGHKKTSGMAHTGSLDDGRIRTRMAEEAPAAAETVGQVLFIHKNDPDRFEALRKDAVTNNKISIILHLKEHQDILRTRRHDMENSIEFVEALHDSGASIWQIAVALCVTPRTVSRWLNGRTKPSRLAQVRIQDVIRIQETERHDERR